MYEFMEQQGYTRDITDQRLHHEIYLSDARKVAPEKLKTVFATRLSKSNKDTPRLPHCHQRRRGAFEKKERIIEKSPCVMGCL